MASMSNTTTRRWPLTVGLAAIAVAALVLAAGAQERDRSKIADKYKWNLADLYPTEEAWRADQLQRTLADARDRRVVRMGQID